MDLPVTATLNYLAPGSVRNRLYVAPGDHLSTTRYDPRTVRIANGRGRRDEFTLDRTRFALVDHRSAVTDFSDASGLDGVYTAEAASLVRQLTGADEVVSLGWMLRRSGTERRGALPPAPDVHVDLHTARVAQRYARIHAKSALPERTCRRAIYTKPAPEKVPDVVGEEDAESAATVFGYSPAHRWWYFPDMHAGEALIFKLYDTDHCVAWRAPHTAFRDAAALEAHPRGSVELRTVAFCY